MYRKFVIVMRISLHRYSWHINKSYPVTSVHFRSGTSSSILSGAALYP